ncbi:MAG: hypothetical protein LBC73_05110 [Oscillospiraceae bacterium]|jgi:hypothetical protein|nr:hypothetical protein [Oscillospiraceae bacterium]
MIKGLKKIFCTFIGKILLCVTIFYIILGVGAFFFYQYINAYEGSRIEHILRYVEENIDHDFWINSVSDALSTRVTEFEKQGIPVELYSSKIKDVSYNLRLNTDLSTVEAPVYTLRAGSVDIGTAHFIATENLGFGFSEWELDTLELLDSFIDGMSRSITIISSINALVELNETLLTEDYRINSDYEYGAMYFIPGIFGDVEVTVIEFNGQNTEPLFFDNNEFIFPITRPFTREYKVITENTLTLLIDDMPVSSEYILKKHIPEILVGLVDFDDSPALLYEYDIKLEGLYLEPILIATNEHGDIILPKQSNDGSLLFVDNFCDELKANYESVAERFIRSYINVTTNGGGNIINMDTSSNLYRRTQTALVSTSWFNFSTTRVNVLEINNFKPYGDEFFTCEIYYEATNTTQVEVREVVIRYEVLFKLIGGNWLVTDMRIIESG